MWLLDIPNYIIAQRIEYGFASDFFWLESPIWSLCQWFTCYLPLKLDASWLILSSTLNEILFQQNFLNKSIFEYIAVKIFLSYHMGLIFY